MELNLTDLFLQMFIEEGMKILDTPHWGKNSQFQNHSFHKIHIFNVSFFTQFTFFKHQILGNLWIKSGFLSQCAIPMYVKTDVGKLFHYQIANFPGQKYITYCNSDQKEKSVFGQSLNLCTFI